MFRFLEQVRRVLCLLLPILIGFGGPRLFAQDAAPSKGERQAASKLKGSYAVHSIVFDMQPDEGSGSMPTYNELFSIIQSRYCDFSLSSRMLRSITYEAIGMRDVPTGITTTLKEFYTRSTINELRYFDATVATLDVYRLRDYFEQLGYHDAKIRFVFEISRDRRNNTLRFVIQPRVKYSLHALKIAGIDTLPGDIRATIESMVSETKLEQFNEPTLNMLAARILDYLHNNGYAFARLPLLPDTAAQNLALADAAREIAKAASERSRIDTSLKWREQYPLAIIDTTRKRDSVTIFLQPLKRYVFGSTQYIDSTRGYPSVVRSLKELQLEFKPGEFYNLNALRRSQAGISSLGPFERVSIDTIARGDSIITTVFTTYKRVWDLGLNLFVNNTFPDNFTNAGIETNLIHRNLFHDANSVNLNARYTWRGIRGDSALKEFEHLLYPSHPGIRIDKELELSLNYAQPDIARLGRYRVDGSLTLNYSDRYIVDPFSESKLSLHISLLIPMAENTERLQFDIVAEGEKPKGYAGAFDRAFQQFIQANPLVDTARLRTDLTERLDPYKKLDDYTGGQFKATNFSLAMNYFADKRNDIFFPSKGYTDNILFEFTPFGQLTNFIRVLGNFYSYGTISQQWTNAFKFRAGHIIWRGFQNSDSGVTNQYIVPADRGFFAGGASSIRSFTSRQLGNPASDDSRLPTNVGDLANYVGWASIIELSYEVRYTFPNYPELGDFLSDKIKRLGFTFFCDAGNAFNRLTPSAYGKAQFTDIINVSNWAVAMGAGLRFATPAGPIRLDFGVDVYNPMVNTHWIWDRNLLHSITAQISLGHAF